jgi:hypothetical protein
LLPILENNCNLNYLDDNWIMHLRTFIFEINASVKIEKIWRPKIQRENDVSLMDMFRSKTNLTLRQLTLVNYWRIYYQVIMLSDICEPGDEQKVQVVFTKETYDRDLKLQQSSLHWPNQQKPGKKGFQLWISCLKQCFEYTKHNRKVNWKLGKWLPDHVSTNKWNCYFDKYNKQIYYAADNSYNCYEAITSRGHTTTYNSNVFRGHIIEIPESAIPALTIHQNTISKCYHSSLTTFPTIQREEFQATISRNWKEYTTNLPEWQRQYLKHSKIYDNDIAYASLTTTDDIFIINDGGTMITNQGTFGSVISNGSEAIYTSNGKCYNNHYYMSSYRSECQAILSGLLSIDHLRRFMCITTHKTQNIKIYCDNKKLIRNLTQYSKYNMTVNDHNKPDYDIIIEIIMLVKELRKDFKHIGFQYVKSKKADDESSVTTLHETKMHKLAHTLAQQAKSMRDIKYFPMPHNQVNVIINEHYVNANLCKIAKKCYSSINTRSFLQTKYDWDDITIENIWWNSHAKALRKLQIHDRIRIQKYIHNHCSTNHRDHKHYDHKPEVCNTCFHSDETEDHILQCKTFTRRKMRKAWIKDIMQLEKKSIPLEIRKAMCLGVKNWLEISTTNQEEIVDKFSNNIQQAFNNQSKIGWDHFVRGRISLTWGAIVNDLSANEQFDTEAWGTKLIDINFKHLLLFWEHRCDNEHGTTKEEQESKLKTKLLNEIRYMQQSSYPRNDNDAKIIHQDFEQLSKLECRQLQDWIVGARIIYQICKKKISTTPRYFTDAIMRQELEGDPG